jgi:mannan endo-1,4-beta-mannosidase
MFNYFMHEKQLNNLLWIYSPYTWQDHLAPKVPLDSHYPGDEYVDIIGPSYYQHPRDGQELGHLPAAWEPLLAMGKPIALGAFGPGCAGVGQLCSDIGESFDCIEFVENLKGRCPECVYFLFWGREWAIAKQLNPAALLDDPWVVNRDEVNWQYDQ